MITIQINFKKIKKKSRCARARVCVYVCVEISCKLYLRNFDMLY